MRNTLMRYIISGATLSFLAIGLIGAPGLVSAVSPQSGTDPRNFEYGSPDPFFQIKNGTANDTIFKYQAYKDPRTLAQNIINIILGFLGIVAVIIIIMAGFQWMTAGGEEEKVSEARQRLIQGAIGLILIIAAWIIAYFIIDQLVKAIQG